VESNADPEGFLLAQKISYVFFSKKKFPNTEKKLKLPFQILCSFLSKVKRKFILYLTF